MMKPWLRKLIFLLTAALIVFLYIQVYTYFEKQDCICAKLTSVEQEFEIDERLRAFYEGVENRSGVFIISSSCCRHGKHIQLTIFPDEGLYKGRLLP